MNSDYFTSEGVRNAPWMVRTSESGNCRFAELVKVLRFIRRIGILLDAQESGEAANYLPSAMRKISIRELMGFPRDRGRIGYSPTMHADAPLGLSRIAYQNAEIAMAKCDAGSFPLARFGAAVPGVRNAPKMERVRGAKVGYCTCCVCAAHFRHSANAPTW